MAKMNIEHSQIPRNQWNWTEEPEYLTDIPAKDPVHAHLPILVTQNL